MKKKIICLLLTFILVLCCTTTYGRWSNVVVANGADQNE